MTIRVKPNTAHRNRYRKPCNYAKEVYDYVCVGNSKQNGLAVIRLDARIKQSPKEPLPLQLRLKGSTLSCSFRLVLHVLVYFYINPCSILSSSNTIFLLKLYLVQVAKENADVIIMDDNFSTIVNVAKWGRAIYINIQKFVQFQLTVNVVALVINFVSACITGSAPLTAVQLLWVNLIMDTLGALALATEPPNDGLMKRTPVGRRTSFITKPMWRNIFGQSLYQLIVLGILTFDGKKLLRITGSDATKVLNTIIFNSFVFCQVFNEINSREIEKINIFRGMFDSKVFFSVIFSTVVFQVVIVEFLGTFASTVPLNWQMWLLSVLIGAVSMPIAAILKCIPVGKDNVKLHHDGYEALPSGPELA